MGTRIFLVGERTTFKFFESINGSEAVFSMLLGQSVKGAMWFQSCMYSFLTKILGKQMT